MLTAIIATFLLLIAIPVIVAVVEWEDLKKTREGAKDK